MYRAKSIPFASDGDCAVARYSKKDDGGINVDNRDYIISEGAFRDNNFDDEEDRMGEAYCSAWRSGWCRVRFFALTPWGNYQILGTDYTSFSVVYSCTTSLGGAARPEWLWILTRDPLEIGTPEHDAMTETVFAVINEHVPGFFDDNELRPTVQTTGSGCEYWPAP